MKFTTIDPVGTGIAAPVGSRITYVDGSKIAEAYLKYGTGDKDWCAAPQDGAAEPVTVNPQTTGLTRPIGARCVYVSAGTGTLLIKYGTAATDWCTLATSALGSSGVSDGDKGDVVVSGSGSTWTVESLSVDGIGSCTADVNFGVGDTTATVTVTGQAWVTATCKIVAFPSGETTADHDPEDALVEEMTAVVLNRVAGVGFDVTAHSPNGSAGTYRLWCIGV